VSQEHQAPDRDPLAPFCDPSPVLIIISGTSGSGKDSVIKRMKELDHPFHFVVTATDRKKRDNEVHGVHYYFISTDEFHRMVGNNEFIEHAVVYDQLKGVPRIHVEQALASGKDVVMRLDVQGVDTMREKIPQAITIFVTPPSLDILRKRLLGRKGDSEEQMQERLETALDEMTRLPEFDYVVINHEGQLDQTAQTILDIISAEKCRVGREPVEL